MRLETELMRGAGPLAVMKLLERREMYGYQLVEALSQRTDGVLEIGQSSLYPMLYNLEAKALVTAREEPGSNGRIRRYYRLTNKGRRKLAADAKQWKSLVKAMAALGVAEPAHRVGVTA